MKIIQGNQTPECLKGRTGLEKSLAAGIRWNHQAVENPPVGRTILLTRIGYTNVS